MGALLRILDCFLETFLRPELEIVRNDRDSLNGLAEGQCCDEPQEIEVLEDSRFGRAAACVNLPTYTTRAQCA